MPPGPDNPSHTGDQEHTTQLADRAKKGDRQAFHHLFHRVAPAIYSFASARIDWRWQDAEDVVAETWVRAWKKLDDYDPNRSFRSWLFGFATRVVLETQRRLAREERGAPQPGFDLAEHPVDATNVSRRVAQDETLRDFVAWMQGLSDYEREVLILRGLQGWPHDRVAEALGRTVNAAKECWRRLLRKVSEWGKQGERHSPLVEWEEDGNSRGA